MENLGVHILRIKNDELTRMDDDLQKIIFFLDSIK